MPVADLNAGRAFVWLVSGFLLSSLAIGGGFLVAYLTLPTSSRTTLFMYVGMIFVCIPWLFWILTCFYRCLSRVTGLRIVCGDADVGGSVAASSRKFGGSAGGGNKTERASSGSVSNRNGRDAVDLSEDNNGRPVRFGDAVTLEEQGDGRNSVNTMSFASHESEMPLAISQINGFLISTTLKI